jgi:hypothetical protein
MPIGQDPVNVTSAVKMKAGYFNAAQWETAEGANVDDTVASVYLAMDIWSPNHPSGGTGACILHSSMFVVPEVIRAEPLTDCASALAQSNLELRPGASGIVTQTITDFTGSIKAAPQWANVAASDQAGADLDPVAGVEVKLRINNSYQCDISATGNLQMVKV